MVISLIFIIFAVAYMGKGKIIIIPKPTKDALEWLKVGKERGVRTKPGAKETHFADFIINNDETDWIINFLKKNIDKDRPRQASLLGDGCYRGWEGFS